MLQIDVDIAKRHNKVFISQCLLSNKTTACVQSHHKGNWRDLHKRHTIYYCAPLHGYFLNINSYPNSCFTAILMITHKQEHRPSSLPIIISCTQVKVHCCWDRMPIIWCIITWANYQTILNILLPPVALSWSCGTWTRAKHHHFHYINTGTNIKHTIVDFKYIKEKGHTVWVTLTLIKCVDFGSQWLALLNQVVVI